MTKYHFMLLVSVILTSIALIIFKYVSVDARGEVIKIITDLRFYFAVFVYAIAFFMWIISASRIDYTVLIFSNTLGLVIGGLLGYLLFMESITTQKIIAYAFVLSGVILLMFTNSRS